MMLTLLWSWFVEASVCLMLCEVGLAWLELLYFSCELDIVSHARRASSEVISR